MNHLTEIASLIRDQKTMKMVTSVRNRFVSTFQKCNSFDFLSLREELFKFLQDRHIRVSLFLQQDIQNTDGSFVLKNEGN